MKHRLFTRMIAASVMVMTLVTTLPLKVFAEEIQNPDPLYIRSVKLSTAGNAADAQAELEAEGYIFLDTNLNAGTGNKEIYLGYTTTTNPDEAVYDMKLMNMNGGFSLTSVENAVKSQQGIITKMAMDLNMIVDEFVQAYNDGTVAAQKAYKALNFFRITADEQEPVSEANGLGYQLVMGNMSIEKLSEILLFCDAAYVDSIVKMLTMGIQTRTQNWVATLSELGPYDSGADYGLDEDVLKERSEELLSILAVYAKAYNAMAETGIVSGEFDERLEIQNAEISMAYNLEAEDNDVKNLDISRYKSYKLAFDELEKFPYGEGTLKDFFCNLEDSSNNKQLYPLVSVLSDGEYAAMSYGCVLEIILGADVTEDDFAQYDEVYDMLTEEVKSVYLYYGVDRALMEDDTVIAFTEEASRHMAATGEMEFYEHDSLSDEIREKGTYAAMAIAGLGMAVVALAKVTLLGTMMITGTWSVSTLCAATKLFGGLMKFCAALGANPWAMVIIISLAATVIICTYTISAIMDWINGKIDWDENPIPEYIYDVKEIGIRQTSADGSVAASYMKAPAFCSYEVVRNIDGDAVDLNGRSKNEREWIALYVSYEALGDEAKPVRADGIKVHYGNGQTPEGYTPLCEFGEVVAKDLNSYDEDNDVNGIFLFYQQDSEAIVESSKTYYISSVYLQAGKSLDHCMLLLENAGYTPVATNLSPDYSDEGWFSEDNIYSCIGYKLTTNKKSALRDLRISYGTGPAVYNYGGASYADFGSSAGVTLYGSKYDSTGTPILAGGLLITRGRESVPAGYEPVNLLSGGPALSFNTQDGRILADSDSQYYLHFLPETTFTEGEKYLGGIMYGYGHLPEMLMAVRNNSVFKKAVLDTIYDEYGYTMPMNNSVQQLEAVQLFLVTVLRGVPAIISETMEGFLCYETYNPYRAIYDVKATNVSGVPAGIMIESAGYVSTSTISFLPVLSYFKNCGLEINNTERVDLSGELFVTGNISGNTYKESTKEMSKRQPLKMTDLIVIAEDTGGDLVPGDDMGYEIITDMYSAKETQVVLKNKDASEGFLFYINKQEEEELPYVNNIYVTDLVEVMQMYGGEEASVTLDMITDGMAFSSLGSMGATEFCTETVDLRGWITAEYGIDSGLRQLDKLFFGYSRTDKKSAAIRDMFFYYDGLSSVEPPDKLYKGSVKYEPICKLNYNFTGYDDAVYPAVYLYATTDSDAGGRIVDFTVSTSPFKDGYEAVRTMDGRSLFRGIAAELEEEKKNQPFDEADNMIDEWIGFFAGAAEGAEENHHELFYLHIQREGYDATAQQYISGVYIARKMQGSKKMVLDDLFDQGADGYLNKDLNAGTIGDSLYLGYSRSTDTAKAITSIKAFHGKKYEDQKTDSNGVIYYAASNLDLNKGAGGDYIYLYYTRARTESTGNPITKITSSSKSGSSKTDTEEITPVKRWDNGKASDLNDGCGFWTDYIYLLVTKPFDCPSVAEVEPDYGRTKTYTRKAAAGSEEGKYISAFFVMDKNTLRQEKLARGIAPGDCECSDIADSEVFERLREMGATTIIETPIMCSSSDYGKGNANKVFIGYTRTDTYRLAIKGLRIHALALTENEPPESITIDNKYTYKVVAAPAKSVEKLPAPINLIGLEDQQDSLVPAMYLYTTTSGDTPIYDICIDSTVLLNGWSTVRSTGGKEAFAEIYEMAKAGVTGIEECVLDHNWFEGSSAFVRNELIYLYTDLKELFDPADTKFSPFYIHCKMFEGTSLEDEMPYISEVFVEKADSLHEVLVKLVSHDPDGYITNNLNQNAGGDKIYLAYKRTDKTTGTSSKPITDLVVTQGKDHSKSIRVKTGESTTAKYDLVADIDLNDGAGGEYLYLYSTKEASAGNPLMKLRIDVGQIFSRQIGCTYESTVMRVSDGKYTTEHIDFNKGTDGDNIFMTMSSLSHTPAGAVEESRIEPTCVKTGSYNMVVYCSGCGELLSTQKYSIPATGIHIDGDDDGDHKCDYCGEEAITGHIPMEAVKENIIQPAEDADGSYDMVVYCSECGEVISTETVTVPAGSSEIPGQDPTDDPGYPASLIGTGSVMAICLLAGAGLLAMIFIIIKKRKKNK